MVKSTYCSYRGLVSSTLAHSYLSHQFWGIQLGTTHAHDAYTHMQASTHTCRIKTLCSISSAFTVNHVLCWLTLILEDCPSPCAFQRSKKKKRDNQPLTISSKDTPPDWLFLFLWSPDWTDTPSLGKNLLWLMVLEGFNPPWQKGKSNSSVHEWQEHIDNGSHDHRPGNREQDRKYTETIDPQEFPHGLLSQAKPYLLYKGTTTSQNIATCWDASI